MSVRVCCVSARTVVGLSYNTIVVLLHFLYFLLCLTRNGVCESISYVSVNRGKAAFVGFFSFCVSMIWNIKIYSEAGMCCMRTH